MKTKQEEALSEFTRVLEQEIETGSPTYGGVRLGNVAIQNIKAAFSKGVADVTEYETKQIIGSLYDIAFEKQQEAAQADSLLDEASCVHLAGILESVALHIAQMQGREVTMVEFEPPSHSAPFSHTECLTVQCNFAEGNQCKRPKGECVRRTWMVSQPLTPVDKPLV